MKPCPYCGKPYNPKPYRPKLAPCPFCGGRVSLQPMEGDWIVKCLAPVRCASVFMWGKIGGEETDRTAPCLVIDRWNGPRKPGRIAASGLRPCPFCGKPPHHDYSDNTIGCHDCGLLMGGEYTIPNRDLAAIWNRRA